MNARSGAAGFQSPVIRAGIVISFFMIHQDEE